MKYTANDGMALVASLPEGAKRTGGGLWDGESESGFFERLEHEGDQYSVYYVRGRPEPLQIRHYVKPRTFVLSQDQFDRVRGMTATEIEELGFVPVWRCGG